MIKHFCYEARELLLYQLWKNKFLPEYNNIKRCLWNRSWVHCSENNHVFVLSIQKIKQASYKEDTRLIDMTLCKTLRKMTYLVCYQSLVQPHLIKIITKCIPFNSCLYFHLFNHWWSNLDIYGIDNNEGYMYIYIYIFQSEGDTNVFPIISFLYRNGPVR